MTNAIRVAKIGKNALSNDPNDLIFNSELNTFKIISEGTKQVTLAASTNNQSFTQAHGLDFIPLVRGFAKESSVSSVFMPNSENVSGWATIAQFRFQTGVKFNYMASDATNIIFNFDNTNGSSIVVDIRYFCLEDIAITPGTPNPGPPTNTNKVVVAKDGFNAITERDPNNLKFSSDYGTLKYFDKVDQIVQLDAAVVPNQQARGIYTHNLGYYPYVEAFVRVYIGSPGDAFEPAPFWGSGASVAYNAIPIIKENTIELYTEIVGVSSSLWNFQFLLFIHKNNLQL